jgi:hypothetical protein
MTMMGVGVSAGGGGTGVFVVVGGSGVSVGCSVGTGGGVGLGGVVGVSVAVAGTGVGGTIVGVKEGITATTVIVDVAVTELSGDGLRTAKSIAATTVSATTMSVPIAINRRCAGDEAVPPLDEDSGKDTGDYILKPPLSRSQTYAKHGSEIGNYSISVSKMSRMGRS